ncbi:hypothetical protein TKK_0015565 [Trichogramma kaykai]
MDIEQDMSLDGFEDTQPEKQRASSPISDQLLQKFQNQPWLDGKYFELLPLESDKKNCVTRCMTCSKLVRGSANVSSNFGLHLKRKHLAMVDEYHVYVKGHKIARKSDDSSQTGKRVTNSYDQDQFNKNVARFVLDNMLAFHTVESSSFRTICSGLLNKYA